MNYIPKLYLYIPTEVLGKKNLQSNELIKLQY